MFRALTESDNTANDAVLRRAGGPAAVRAMLERNRLDGIRFGPGERLLQSGIAGLQWQPAFSEGNAFYQARNAVPIDRRRAAFERYIDDPVDGATPNGITAGLARLQRGELLSPRIDRAAAHDHDADPYRPAAPPRRPRAGLDDLAQDRHRPGARQRAGRL